MSRDQEEYDQEQIVTCVERNMALEPPQLLEAIFAGVWEFSRGAPQSDDITAMGLRYGG